MASPISLVSTLKPNITLLFSSPTPNPILLHSSLLPPNTIPLAAATTTATKKERTISVSSSSSSTKSPIKMVRCPVLDRHASKHNRLRFVRKLRTLLLSKPRHFLPLRVLSRCRPYLSLPPSRSVLSMLLRYPAIFHLFHSPPSPSSPTSSSNLCVGLTPAAASLAADESLLRSRIADSLATKLQKLLMLSYHRRLLLSKLAHVGPDLGFSPDFRSRLCNSHPHRFRTVDTSFGRALELVDWDSTLAVPHPPFLFDADSERIKERPIIDRPPKFKQLKLRRGLNLKRRHRDYLIRLQELPESSPYSLDEAATGGSSLEAMEKRACAVVREVLAMTLEKRTLVDHLTHFRKEFGLPNKLRAMLVRHPEVFYVSVRGQRNSVFLVEAYNGKGKLMVEDELLPAKERLLKLVREGKRMRRERKRDVSYGDESEDDEDEDDIEDVIDDGLDDLFETGIGDDWEEFDANDGIHAENGLREQGGLEDFWIRKAIGERVRGTQGGMEAW